MDIAGHVSKQRLKHYSHIRMEEPKLIRFTSICPVLMTLANLSLTSFL
jgi:hypothetical protein